MRLTWSRLSRKAAHLSPRTSKHSPTHSMPSTGLALSRYSGDSCCREELTGHARQSCCQVVRLMERVIGQAHAHACTHTCTHTHECAHTLIAVALHLEPASCTTVETQFPVFACSVGYRSDCRLTAVDTAGAGLSLRIRRMRHSFRCAIR